MHYFAQCPIQDAAQTSTLRIESHSVEFERDYIIIRFENVQIHLESLFEAKYIRDNNDENHNLERR